MYRNSFASLLSAAVAATIIVLLWFFVIEPLRSPKRDLTAEGGEVGIVESVQKVNARDSYALVTVDGLAYTLDGDVSAPDVGARIRFVADGNEMSEWTDVGNEGGW